MILLFVSSHLLHFTAYHLPSVHASQTNVELEREVLPRFMPSPCFGMQKRFSHPNVHVGGAKALLDHLYEGHLVRISFMSNYCNHIAIHTSHNASVYVKLYLQPFQQKLAYRNQVGMQLEHMKHVHDINSSRFASHFNSNDNGPYSDDFSNAIIT
jgi:hypothetical protein